MPPQAVPPPQGDITPAVYDLAAGRYDLVVEAGPSFNTKREESVAQMTELLRAYPPAAPIIGDLLVKNMDWPGADEIAQRLRSLVPATAMGQQPVPPQVQQQLDQMRQVIQAGGQHLQDLTQQLQSATTQLEAEKADKAIEAQKLDLDQQKANTDAYNAETQRLKVQADIAAANVTPPAIVDEDAGLARWKAEQEIALKRDTLAHQAAMQTSAQNHALRLATITRRGTPAAQPDAGPADMAQPPTDGGAPDMADGSADGPSTAGESDGSSSTGMMSPDVQSSSGDPFAEIAAAMQAQGAQIGAGMTAIGQALQIVAAQNAETMRMVADALMAPKELVRDAKGRPAGVRTLTPETATLQ